MMLHKGLLVLVLFFVSWVSAQECDIAGECVGDLHGFTYEETANDCLAACQGVPECAWYSYNTGVINNDANAGIN